MTRTFAPVVAVLLMGALPSGARATVVREEPNETTVGSSDAVALAVTESIEGKGPFTNGRPPTVVLRVVQAIKGCRAEETLRVVGWSDTNAASCSPKGFPLSPAECQLHVKAWGAAPVAAPAGGSRQLVFLKRDGAAWRPYFNEWSRRITFAEPDPRLVGQVVGLASFTFEARRELGEIASGSQLVVKGVLKNVSPHKRVFEPGLMVLHGQVPGRTLKDIVPRPGAEAARPVTLGPGESREVAWELMKLFPVALQYPGPYWLRLEVPAHCTQGHGNNQDLDFTVTGTPTLEAAVASSPVVFVARAGQRVPQQGGRVDVVLEQREILKSDGSEANVPLQVAWPQPRIPLPKAGEWLIVCAAADEVRCAEARTPEALARVKALIKR